ncbi:Zinc finger, MIZ-type domain-containing protein [Strongyloides ratti]|uniref:Zinc finger, MIZ-type domain-containing protein n=1 Tax=Strongyloides ratti TaxID=34506 RepID=A0A090L4I3_STRRB|nr:Zinc finger, MIZ-type domain-containing protein [Strongyloides ratti]CEF64627.1 Zinc finger, MIZ-type domain-containing protein [Strongyloides ratti]
MAKSTKHHRNSNSNKIFQPEIIEKKLFFYEEKKILCTYEEGSRNSWFTTFDEKNKVTFCDHDFKFCVSSDILMSLTNPNTSNLYDIILRYISNSTNDESYSEKYPLDMEIFINDRNYTKLLPKLEEKNIPADFDRRVSYPTIITPAIINGYESSSQEKNDLISSCLFRVFIRYPLETGRRSHVNNKHFYFKIAFCLKNSPKAIINKLLKLSMLETKTFVMNIIKEFKPYEESMVIPLLSPTTKNNIILPFRGKYCEHLFPDDLECYLNQNVGNEEFLCRFCGNKCTPDDIFIDEYYYDILEKNPKITKIEVFKSGKYNVLETNDSHIKKNKKNNYNFINIDDVIFISGSSNDENDIKIYVNMSKFLWS